MGTETIQPLLPEPHQIRRQRTGRPLRPQGAGPGRFPASSLQTCRRIDLHVSELVCLQDLAEGATGN